ncbi:MAG TPA: MurT ligase domain-containing protein [Ktedonobacterales bacterium]|nr:MurT ligase domain-containing protein [Ktedonobacterales bacterium]
MDTQQSDVPAIPSGTETPAVRSASRRVAYPWQTRARAATAVVAGRASGALARRLRLGAGTSLPGLVARRVDPTIARYLAAQLRHGSVVITGTNGKTTTSGLVAYVLRAGGLRVWRNREGANLARGITAALIIRTRPTGRLRWHGNAAAVFEVDEAAFPQVITEVRPRAIVITNLFRDQLDRYGEVDTVAERWRDALKALPADTQLVLNADDPAVAALADGARDAHVLYFGVEDAPVGERADTSSVAPEVIDTRTCPRCRAPLTYALRFYSHIGHWACPTCGYARPRPAVFARAIVPDGFDGMRFMLVTTSGEREVRIALPGLYNVYNALAAAAVGIAMGCDTSAAAAALARFTPAFGRAERIQVNGREVRLLLAKNPTGLNEVLRALAAATTHPHLLMLLNDHAADGEDVSWIWDAGLEQVAALAPASLTVSGTRAYDLALRLKYAGAPVAAIEMDAPRALDAALARTPDGDTLYVVPTYTAMLAVRAELERRGYAPHYWEQRDV